MIKYYICRMSMAIMMLISPMLMADVTVDIHKAAQYMSKGNYSQANYYYFKALSVDPNNVEAQFGLAQSFANQNDYQRARTELDKLFLVDTRHQAGLLLSASLYLLENNYLSALQIAQQVNRQNPGNAQAYMYMSSAYTGLGDEVSARKAMASYQQLSTTQQ